MTAQIRTNTSRFRFDEARRFTGVYQRMGQVGVDADWNEEVRLRTVDARRRTADLAEGSPDDGFRIAGDFLVDPITSVAGWTGMNPPPDDERKLVPELRLDRHDPESLPWVLRARWYDGLTRTLPAPLDLTAVRGGGVVFAASAVVFELRIDRVLPDDQIANVRLFLSDGTQTASVLAIDYGYQAGGWQDLVVPVAAFAGVSLGAITSWGLTELPPVGITRVGGLRAVDPGLGTDVVIRGGDRTLVGAGRMLVEGVRLFNEADLRFTLQPDFPEAPAVPPLPGDDSLAHVFYLDVWETTVTALDDDTLIEPALDGADTSSRLRVVSQVRLLPLVDPAAPIALPAPTGTGRLTTNIDPGALPDRAAPEPIDPCRDRCLFTENASTGAGYIGSDNLHVRLELYPVGAETVVVWSRDNGSTAMPLVQAAAAGATSLKIAPADAARLRAGDVILVEDRATRLRWDAPTPPVLRKLRGVQAETGILELEDAGTLVTYQARSFDLGGPLGRAFAPAAGAMVRRWDGADLVITGVRYRLSDGITFAFSGDGFRAGDYWTFTARVHAPDGQARGFVDKLDAVLPHGPVHSYRALGRAKEAPRVFEDLRARYLPLGAVRDRLKELADRRVGPPVFTIVIGDGETSFGDIDQSLADGITADEALHTALAQLGDAGGSLFLRAGTYQLEHTVLVRNPGGVRILGDGDATRLEVRGAGGAFYVDRAGTAGAVSFEDLNLIEDPASEVDIGEPDPARAFQLLLEQRYAALPVVPDRVLELDDLSVATIQSTFLELVGQRLKMIGPGAGRASGSVVATLVRLHQLQREHPGQPLEDVPEAQPLLTALAGLPHGVITVVDSRNIAVRRCRLESRRPGAEATGILITGACHSIAIAECRIAAATGIAAVPLTPYLAEQFLAAFPRAGMRIDGLELLGNHITALGAAATGVQISDGVLEGVAIRDNVIDGHVVGILVEDAAESTRDLAVDRMLIAGNRVLAAACGIQVSGDGCDVVDNEVALDRRDLDTLVQIGIAIAGHAVRVSGSWIALPDRAAFSPLGLCAGIAIGDGLDDGDAAARPVYDVEVTGNRIEGPGDAGLAIGVIVGGPQAVCDVRVKDNVLRNLGDAAVRSFSTSAPIVRLRIEGNRIERAALADVPYQFANTPALTRLWPQGAASLAGVDTTLAHPLLTALVGSSTGGLRPALDAALRWVERLTLRGAIVLAGVDGADVVGNRIAEVGRGAYAGIALPGASVRTAAIAAAACAELTVADNAVEAVRAPHYPIEIGDAGLGRPALLDVLDSLGDAADDRIDLAHLHLALADLRTRLLHLTQLAPDAQATGLRALFGALDAVASDLTDLGGPHVALATPLVREIALLRVTTGTGLLGVLQRTRATLSRAAALTAPDADAADAWDAAAQLDLALGVDDTAVVEAAVRLLGRLDELTAGLDPALAVSLRQALQSLSELPAATTPRFEAARQLGRVAYLKGALARRRHLPNTSELVGPRRTIVTAFTQRALDQVLALPSAGSETRARIEELALSKTALARELRLINGGLVTDLEADFRDVDRTNGGAAAIVRMRGTLDKVQRLIDDGTVADILDEQGADRQEIAARTAAIHLYSRTLDRHVSGLLSESIESVQSSLGSFPPLLVQLASLSQDDPDVALLATEAGDAIAQALADPPQRATHLATARTRLTTIRTRLVPVLPEDELAPPRTLEAVERRLAGVTAVLLELTAIELSYRTAACAAMAAHLDRAFTVLRADAAARDRIQAAVEAVRVALGGTAGVLDAASHTLMKQIDATAELARIAIEDSPGVAALRALTAAVTLALDPGEDATARLSRVKTYLAGHTAQVSPVLAAQVASMPDLPGALGLLREALERIARGESPGGDRRRALFTVRPEPADGVFVAGATVRARVTGNAVEEALTGIAVINAAGHALTEPPDDGAIIEVGNNRLTGCATVGADVRTDGLSTVVVWDNHVFGCGGLAVGGRRVGQPVLAIAGAGELVVRGNVLRENGNRGTRTLVHEIFIDWRGEVVVRGNTIRHLGGGAGGSGLLVLADPAIDPATIRYLSKLPFLGVEPAPRPVPHGRPRPSDPICGLGMSTLATQVATASPFLELGGLRQALTDDPVVHRALTVTDATRIAVPAAAALAERYLTRSRTFVAHPLIDHLRRPALRIALPVPRRVIHSVHVEGNDISAHGPALMLLSEGTAIWAANVVGNELRSFGRTGAVYLRRVDSTVFTGNRVQSHDVVVAAVLRLGKAPATVTGNVILSAQPIAHHPRRALPLHEAGAVTLQVGVGKGALSIPVDPRGVLGSIERRRSLAGGAFADALADLLAMQPAEPEPMHEAAPLAPLGTYPVSGIELDPAVIDTATRNWLLQLGITPRIGAQMLYERAGQGDSPMAAFRKLVDRIALHTDDPVKLRTQIAAIVRAANGDPIQALRMFDEDVIGLDLAKPTVRDAVTNTSLVAEALADHLAAAAPVRRDPSQPRPRPVFAPRAPAHSLVLIGGTHVAAVGNATTAGILVLETDQVVELNL